MQLRKITRFAVVVVLVALTTTSAFAARGRADFTRYVAIGDSLTAGFTNSSLVVTHQVVSYPALIARQARTPDFQQPLVSEPGIPPELQLVSLSPLVIAPKAATNGAPINLNLPRPYNNLGVPGMTVRALLTLTGAQQPTNTPTTFAQFILRGLGTAPDQALALQPTFMTVWIGPNDVLGAVLSGTPAALTSRESFEADYNALMTKLTAGAPNAGMLAVTIPPVSAIPFAVTIPPVIVNPATSQPVLGPNGQPIFLFAELGDGTVGQLTPGSLVTLGAASLLATGFGIPPTLAPNFPNLPNAGKPLPAAVVLTTSEVAQINARTAELNSVIASVAASKDIPLLDLTPVFNQFRQGVNYGGGIRLSTAFLTGGLISFDGVHPTDLGYALVANEMIRTINRAYGSRIPSVPLTAYFANNDTEDERLPLENVPFEFTLEAYENLKSVLAPEEVEQEPVPVRRRGTRR